ncbi:hypothetical protein C6379_16790, partial [Pseudomonas syringae pv. actinidiae]
HAFLGKTGEGDNYPRHRGAVSIPMEGVLMSSESVSAEMPVRGFFQDYKLASYSKLVLLTQSLKESL